MGTISEKLTYLNTTKSNLKDMINYGLPSEEQITSSTTFRNYVTSIFEAFLESLRDSETLYTNLPKKSGNGTQITLNDTAYSPMRITLGSSALSQDGTPTPNYPQDIHTISGSNSIVVEGKNLFDTSNYTISGTGLTITRNEDGSFNINGTNSGNVSIIFSNEIELNGEYTIATIEKNPVTNSYFNIYSNNNVTGTIEFFTTSSTNHYKNFTYTGKTLSQRILFGPGTYNNFRVSIEILKGTYNLDTIGTYEEYKGQTNTIDLSTYNLGSIGNYENKFIRSDGENILDTTTFVKGRLDSGVLGYAGGTTSLTYTNTSISFTTNNNYRGVTSDYIKVLPSTDYVYSQKETMSGIGIRVACYDSSKTYIQDKTKQTFTTPSNCEYIRICFIADTISSTTINELMLNKGTTALPYTPYEKGWYYKEGIGKVVLDGSEDNWGFGSFGDYYRANISASGIIQGLSANDTLLYCNYFYPSNDLMSSTTARPGMLCHYRQNEVVYFGTEETTVGNWKTWLSTHNTIVYYRLNTPTYTKLTDTTLINQLENTYKNMLSYKGTTNISQVNNDLPFTLSVSAIEDLEA